jgi:hypothetical protein
MIRRVVALVLALVAVPAFAQTVGPNFVCSELLCPSYLGASGASGGGGGGSVSCLTDDFGTCLTDDSGTLMVSL